jgi:hyperosmotically inducible protein
LPTADNVNTPSGKSSVRTLVDDSILTTKIKAGMLADPGVKATEVSVETNSGEVTLSGAVSSHPEMEEAERIAKSVSGVKTVVNKLTLKK